MNIKSILAYLDNSGQPSYRQAQFLQFLQTSPQTWSDLTVFPKNLIREIETLFAFQSWHDSTVYTSADGTQKASLILNDGQIVETVLMEPKPGHWSVCVSSEVGCPMNCAFCATGAMGFKRQLSSEEIADQILFWHQFIRRTNQSLRIQSVVYMGMGEPFHNAANVFTSLHWLHDYYGLGYRHLSVSTCGIPQGINELATSFPQVNLAISLHSALDTTRNMLMPINHTVNLSQLSQVIRHYLETTNREVMFEYLLLAGVNDSKEASLSLIMWLKTFPPNLIHLNLIRYNDTDRGFASPAKKDVRQFADQLERAGISVTIRKSLGQDISGACGQLATRHA